MKIKTVGELKEAIKDLDDNIKIIRYRSDMETSGNFEGIYLGDISKYKKEKKETYDRFDYTDYSYEVFVKDENGKYNCIEL